MIMYTSITPSDLVSARYKELQSMLIERKNLLTSLYHDKETVKIQIIELESVISIYDKWIKEQNASTNTSTSG